MTAELDYGDWGHPLWKVLGPRGVPYEPFPWQRDLIHKKNGIPRLIGCCGRRSGKTTAIGAEVVRDAFPVVRPPKPPLIYVVAPNYELVMKLWEPLWRLFVNLDGPLHSFEVSHDKQRKIIDLAGGTRLQAKSGDDPKSVQGDRVTTAAVDEAQDLIEEAWANLMPGLLDSHGSLRAIGIARGKGRFRTYFERGLQGHTDYNEVTGASARFDSFTVSSYDNPEIKPEWIEEMKDEHSEIEFRQQYLAEWVEQDGQVFRNVEACFTGAWEKSPYESVAA